MEEKRIVLGTSSDSPLNDEKYRLEYGHFHYTVSESLRVLQEKRGVKEFHSEPRLTFSDTLLSRVHSTLEIADFVKILFWLPTYFGVIVNEEIRIIIRDVDVIDNSLRVIVSKLRSWEEFRRCFQDLNVRVRFNGIVYDTGIFDIVRIYCLGEPFIARYSGIVDNMNYQGNGLLNLWSDYIDDSPLEDNTIPEVNEVILNYIDNNMSGNQVDIYNYHIMWFSSMVLRPDRKTRICPTFVGEDPAKSLFAFLGKHVFKHRYRKISKLEDLTGKENHKLIASSLVLCNEFKGKHEFTDDFNTVRPFVTEPTIHIEHTNFDIGSVSNFVIFTDNKDVVGSKYFPVFDVKPSTVNVFESLTEADAYNFVKWLTYIDLTGFDIEDAPNNHKVTQKPTETNLQDILHSMYIDNIPVDPRYSTYGIKLGDVYDRYLQICKYHLRRPPVSKNIFYSDIRKYYNKDEDKEYIVEEHGHKGWYLRRNKKHIKEEPSRLLSRMTIKQ